jgi:hypothetical protein
MMKRGIWYWDDFLLSNPAFGDLTLVGRQWLLKKGRQLSIKT